MIGGTGYIGKFVVEASAKAGHPTFALVRESTAADPVKGQLVESFKNSGVTLVHVCMHASFIFTFKVIVELTLFFCMHIFMCRVI